jgi:CRP-like cAMP-binding protein
LRFFVIVDLLAGRSLHVATAASLTFVGNRLRVGVVSLQTSKSSNEGDAALDREVVLAALLRRLNTVTGLEEADLAAIRELPIIVRPWEAGRPIVSDGDRPSECCLLIEGFCVRAKTTANGQRQILSIHVPGDIPDLQSLHLHRMDHDLIPVVSSTLGFISHTSLRGLTRAKPNVAEKFWRDSLIDAAMFRQWIVNVGQRPADSRLAHTVLELRQRLAVIGRAAGDTFDMPLTQEQIAEALGITPVHANRVIRQLREAKIVDISRGRVAVLNEAKLAQLAQFDDRYLHQSPTL